MKWMNLNHLKYFLVIAQEGSLSAASKKLMVGQPALSTQLKQFEDWLGVQLFDRVGKKLVLNRGGEYVLKYAREIKSIEDELMLNIAHANEEHRRELVVVAQESVPKTVISGALAALQRGRQVKLSVVEGKGEELFDRLVEGKADFFIGNFRPQHESKEMFYVSLGKENVSVWGAPKFQKLRANFPTSLSGADFALPGLTNPIRHDFEKWMFQRGIGFNVAIEAQDTALLKELGALGQGLILMGDESVHRWEKSKALVKLGTLQGLGEEYWLGMAKKSVDNEFVRAVLGELR